MFSTNSTVAAHRAGGMFIPYTLRMFSKSSFLPSQHLKAPQVVEQTPSPHTGQEALPDLTPAHPSLAVTCTPSPLSATLASTCPHDCTLTFSSPLPTLLLRNPQGSGPPFFQVCPQKARNFPASCPHSPPHFRPWHRAPLTPGH